MIYVLVVCAIALLGFPRSAHAYLDATTGSIVLQVIVGGFLATTAVVRMYWSKLKRVFGGHRDEKDAMGYVAGFCLHNDYSEREFQLERNGQWVKGKSCDSFAPIGPYLVTKDEIADYNNLHMWLKVNGKKMQDNNTDDMIFHVPYLVSYISQFMTLLPGDVISTGTPAGVGLGFKPPIFVKPGDVIELGIEGLGEQRQVARNY